MEVRGNKGANYENRGKMRREKVEIVRENQGKVSGESIGNEGK